MDPRQVFIFMFTSLVSIRCHPREVSHGDFMDMDKMAPIVAQCAEVAMRMQGVVDDVFPRDREVQ